MAWTCPNCDRRFGAPGQSHMCAPGLTLTEYFAGARPEAEPIFHAINDHLETLDGDLIVDPVNARKILFKNGPTFAILDSMTKWVALGVTLTRKLDTPRQSRKVTETGSKYHHVFNLTGAEMVDDEMLGWLTEAFHQGKPPSAEDDALIPDDIDEDFLGDAL